MRLQVNLDRETKSSDLLLICLFRILPIRYDIFERFLVLCCLPYRIFALTSAGHLAISHLVLLERKRLGCLSLKRGIWPRSLRLPRPPTFHPSAQRLKESLCHAPNGKDERNDNWTWNTESRFIQVFRVYTCHQHFLFQRVRDQGHVIKAHLLWANNPI